MKNQRQLQPCLPFELVRHIYSFLDGYYDFKRHCWIARINVSLPQIMRPSIVSTVIHGRESLRSVLKFQHPDLLFYAELRKTVTEYIEYSWSYYEQSKTHSYAFVYTGNRRIFIDDTKIWYL